jgi:UDP-3-O-[3-hydroxymyristoyl] glucosamine N-acyltransferase
VIQLLAKEQKLIIKYMLVNDTIIVRLIAAQTGIAGCVIIEDEVTIWGQVGTTSGTPIGAKAVILRVNRVTKSVEGGNPT